MKIFIKNFTFYNWLQLQIYMTRCEMWGEKVAINFLYITTGSESSGFQRIIPHKGIVGPPVGQKSA